MTNEQLTYQIVALWLGWKWYHNAFSNFIARGEPIGINPLLKEGKDHSLPDDDFNHPAFYYRHEEITFDIIKKLETLGVSWQCNHRPRSSSRYALQVNGN